MQSVIKDVSSDTKYTLHTYSVMIFTGRVVVSIYRQKELGLESPSWL